MAEQTQEATLKAFRSHEQHEPEKLKWWNWKDV